MLQTSLLLMESLGNPEISYFLFVMRCLFFQKVLFIALLHNEELINDNQALN